MKRLDNVELRPATEADAWLIWKWRNDPAVSAASFSSDSVDWQSHRQWLESKLADRNCFIFIGVVETTPVGIIRFDVEGTEAEVSVSVVERGKGYGTELIRAGCDKIAHLGVTFVANVKSDNIASQRAFAKAGFAPVRMVR